MTPWTSRRISSSKIAPRAVFDTLAERRTRPRFMLPTADGDWTVVTWGASPKQIREAALF